ncbi:unannotated protein [freshwater metagenome]|uniref:Unannotated protein n=1 Tax=freshwater metagenome TaxID=449393 RepID=A0A6J6SBR4_9ZZZZ
MRWRWSSTFASSNVVPTGAVTSGEAVMNSVTERPMSAPEQKRVSRFVRIPARRRSPSVIGTPETL